MVTTAFLSIGKPDLRSAAQYLCDLPYGRNSKPHDPLIVLAEARGTCSTKHALVRRLAMEQGIDLALVLGIYEMTGRNTPGVGAVLRQHGLSSLPEAHCYLRRKGRRVDITRNFSGPSSQPILDFLHEEEIGPDQITHYKIAVHKNFLQGCLANNHSLSGFSLDQLWAIREECIATLSQSGTQV